jgi:hypothetical protein
VVWLARFAGRSVAMAGRVGGGALGAVAFVVVAGSRSRGLTRDARSVKKAICRGRLCGLCGGFSRRRGD